ncbi:hypothetical protein ACQPXM_06105 [Kribbella sp. CA-253562]|uniref:hypothetical protein n=1 Tax=Kribbella sp. CA-253562 TaxID=3239942 RepID=UPI003D8AE402
MNHKRLIIATPVLAVAALAFTSAQSNAKLPPDDQRPAAVVPKEAGPPNYPTSASSYPVPTQPSTDANLSLVDDTAAEALQAGASGLGGAAIAFAGMWLYRRRQTHTA